MPWIVIGVVAVLAGCTTERTARSRNGSDPVTAGSGSACSITCEVPGERNPRWFSIDCPAGMAARCSCASSPHAYCVSDPTAN